MTLSVRTGGCRCGAIGFSVSGEAVGGIACHCRDCQYAAGGAANLSWVFEAKALTLTKGKPRVFKAHEGSGGSFFCGDCGTQLYSRPDSNAYLIAVKIGALDDATGFIVEADLWMQSAPTWHHPHSGAKQFDGNFEE